MSLASGSADIYSPEEIQERNLKTRCWFLSKQDMIRAHQYGLKTPDEVLQLRVQGKSLQTSEDDVDLVLVRANIGSDGQTNEVVYGNAAVILLHLGQLPTTFGPRINADTATTTESLPKDPQPLRLPMLAYSQEVPYKTNCQASYDEIMSFPRTGSTMTSQIGWSETNPPASAAILEPSADASSTVEKLYGRYGERITGHGDRPLRAFDHVLPRKISTDVETYMIVYWQAEDPRITWSDICDRMDELPTNGLQYKSFLNLRQRKAQVWRQHNGMMSVLHTSRKAQAPEVFAIENLSYEQLQHNTSWTLSDDKRYVQKPGCQNPANWSTLPQRQWSTDNNGFSWRVSRATTVLASCKRIAAQIGLSSLKELEKHSGNIVKASEDVQLLGNGTADEEEDPIKEDSVKMLNSNEDALDDDHAVMGPPPKRRKMTITKVAENIPNHGARENNQNEGGQDDDRQKDDHYEEDGMNEKIQDSTIDCVPESQKEPSLQKAPRRSGRHRRYETRASRSQNQKPLPQLKDEIARPFVVPRSLSQQREQAVETFLMKWDAGEINLPHVLEKLNCDVCEEMEVTVVGITKITATGGVVCHRCMQNFPELPDRQAIVDAEKWAPCAFDDFMGSLAD